MRRAPRPTMAMRQPRMNPNVGTRAATGAGRNGVANTGRHPGGNAPARNRSSVLGNGSSNPTASGNQNGTGQRLTPGSTFSGWANPNTTVASRPLGNRTAGYGFSGWGSGYGGGGYGYGGYGSSGWGNGYGSGGGMGNGQYVWVFIRGLGWVYVPIRLLLMLGL
jgi:hypothetical protein